MHSRNYLHISLFFFCDVKCQKENVLGCRKCLWVQFYWTYLIYLCVFKSLTTKVDFDCLEMAFQLLVFVGLRASMTHNPLQQGENTWPEPRLECRKDNNLLTE